MQGQLQLYNVRANINTCTPMRFSTCYDIVLMLLIDIVNSMTYDDLPSQHTERQKTQGNRWLKSNKKSLVDRNISVVIA